MENNNADKKMAVTSGDKIFDIRGNRELWKLTVYWSIDSDGQVIRLLRLTEERRGHRHEEEDIPSNNKTIITGQHT